jgi:signal transduction histidine kinase
MKCLLPPGRSLNFYALMAWLFPSITAAIVCIFAFFGIALIEYRNGIQHTQSELIDNSNTVARRVSAELLLGPRGAPESVSESLRQDLSLTSVEITAVQPPCWNKGVDVCSVKLGSDLLVYRSIPVVSGPQFVAVTKPVEPFINSLKIANLLWSTLPIALMFGVGIFFQRSILRRYFLKPIQSLVATSTGDQDPRPYWPAEVREISERLYRSFEARDSAVFSQIARGVIHDLRTLIQSPLAAMELAQESKSDPSKRHSRLENLERVCGHQLPKIREIIDTTLDGSRDIAIDRTLSPIGRSISGAAKTLEPLLAQTGTKLKVSGDFSNFLVAHDSLQLERALTNLLKNGIEASAGKQNGNAEVALTVRNTSNQVIVDIEDSGPGLRIQTDRLFRPLKSTKPHGSGLGLVICRKIITAHGGELLPTRSESLGGAKFSVVLPMSQEAT